MDNVLPPIPPKEHDFSQQSLSSLRSVTVTTSNKSNNGGAGGCTDNNNGSQNSQLSNINSQQNSQLSNINNSQLSGPKLEVLESQQSQSQLSNPSQSNLSVCGVDSGILVVDKLAHSSFISFFYSLYRPLYRYAWESRRSEVVIRL